MSRIFLRRIAISGCFFLAVSLLSLCAVPAGAATWTKIADNGIENPADWQLAAGPVFEGNLIIYCSTWLGLHGPGGAGMYTFDGEAFSMVGSLGFGNANNQSLQATMVYDDELYIGTGNGVEGCELYTWDGSGDPTKIMDNGFGEGADNDTCIPLAVYKGELYVSLSNRQTDGTGGLRLYKYDGTTWTEVMGPGSPVTGGFGNQYNEACAFAVIYDGKLVMPTLNDTQGFEVWTFDGTNFACIGQPGDPGLWSTNQISGIVALSSSENLVYMGTGDNSGTEGGELYNYGGGGWTKLKSGGLDGGVNDSMLQPYILGDTLYIGTLTYPPLPPISLTNSSRVYKRTGSGYEPISQVGLGDSGNWGVHVFSYKQDLVATTLNFGGGQVWTTPSGPTTYYFAEGYTGEGFQEYICLGNPGTEEASAVITYLFPDGTTSDQPVTIPALSRQTVNVNGFVGSDKQVSAQVTSEYAIVAERPMYFLYDGVWSGGHDAVGATSTSDTWYFAEGYTGAGFSEWICVLNPSPIPADLTFSFQTQEEGLKEVGGFSVPAHSRGSFLANQLLDCGSYQTSLKLTSTVPVVAERPMYFSYYGTAGWGWEGGHCVMGTPDLSNSYYFAEGTTRPNFEEWLTLQNPNDYAISVAAVYQPGPGQGTPVPAAYEVGPNYRRTLYVPTEAGKDKDVSILLACDDQFLAERPMYFSYSYEGLEAQGGHCVIGASAPATDWFLAEGYTGPGYNEWICLQNPGLTGATVTITYYTQEVGPLEPVTVPVDPGARNTVMVNKSAGAGYQLSAGISSDVPIVVERPMYFNTGIYVGGHDVMGYAP
ncbi:MAG: DUF5719 family protein [Actinomycetota bacterium]|nr:DUF5719 family protein [Actinomycetota bacterium]